MSDVSLSLHVSRAPFPVTAEPLVNRQLCAQRNTPVI